MRRGEEEEKERRRRGEEEERGGRGGGGVIYLDGQSSGHPARPIIKFKNKMRSLEI